MKNTLFIFSILFLFSCTVTNKIGSHGEKYKLSRELVSFLASFEQSVASHNSVKTLQFMDSDYKKEQLEGMLDGRTKQFLNEFFSGRNVTGSSFKSAKFNEITGIHFVSIQKTDTGYTVYYIVSEKDFKLNCTWDISVKKTERGIVYGLIGAVG